jgi:hypothetical protein
MCQVPFQKRCLCQSGRINSLHDCVVHDLDRRNTTCIRRRDAYSSTQPAITMKLKLTHVYRSLTYLGWATAFGFIGFTTPAVVTSAAVTPFDEPPCYMRTQDGRIVNLQSLCSHTTPQPTPSSPTTNQPTQRMLLPQTTPTQVNAPLRSFDPSGSHAHGNPDSDDGRY